MDQQVLILRPMPYTPWDLATSAEIKQPNEARNRESVVQSATLQVARSSGVDKRPSDPCIPAGLFFLPQEIQSMIWAEKMQKPGLHFLAIHVPLRPTKANTNAQGIRKAMLTEPLHKVTEISAPYHSYFPRGMRSAYQAWADLSDSYPFAREALQRSLVEPLTLPTIHNVNVTIDAATDLVYLKFHWRPHEKGILSQYLPSPTYWMLILDNSLLNGVRRIALEIKRSTTCIFWPNDPNDICGRCGKSRDVHDNEVSSELWLIADFLHGLRDLEAVYLIFNDIEQGPFDPVRDPCYTVSGVPDVRGRSEKKRWSTTSATVFRCDGGSVRELRGGHVILPVANIVETLQAYYIFHQQTGIGGTYAVSKRTKQERYPVQFKLATVVRDGK